MNHNTMLSLLLFSLFSLCVQLHAMDDNNNSTTTANTNLIQAIICEDLPKVVQALNDGANPNHIFNQNNTPLLIATWRNYYSIIKVLLENGASVNQANQFNYTPLHYAAEKCDLKTINLLLQSGADVSRLNKSNETPFMLAQKKQRPQDILVQLNNAGNN